jgi:hypothetical protein
LFVLRYGKSKARIVEDIFPAPVLFYTYEIRPDPDDALISRRVLIVIARA